ncbi:SO_0444 family Cu/Zn efflux transporter [Pseudoalteromonas obscura]|uniref:SO_0444 family Cu/Zn efflux transporter n=1 Tax=Pseudoalteromonas obscura TaxID=3048491 RepID=A0ABT7EKZ4_9GAMM|nr:SO_0444 family Cu/Zn efflux transporter [Pseudoalteromonas sp. P94(2023)]MDK2595703.1 SO_0444 family Cu/Zn efflux transporter [Pseudoalteromonas sp. P94(2023)]
MTLISNFWQLFVISAPWLMLGLLLAGLLNVFIPKDFLQRHLGKEGLWTTVKAALIGAPMPLCSCGVIPAAIGLRRAGGSKSATTAFLVSTPETGVDSISVSYAMLGPFMAIIRPIAAVVSAITAGLLVGRDNHEQSVDAQHSDKPPQAAPCCTKAPQAAPKSEAACCTKSSEAASVCREQVSKVVTEPTATCCGAESVSTALRGTHNHKHMTSGHQQGSCPEEEKIEQPEVSACCSSQSKSKDRLPTKLWQAVKFSCNKLLSDTMVWLLIGIFFAALVQTYVPTEFLAQWGDGILAMIVVILISIPMYICATASTPIAAGLLLAGVSPGAVLVFMLAGPATNVATIGVVAKELGRRAVAAYITAVIGVAILFGFLTDYLVLQFGFEVAAMAGHQHEVLPSWLSQICAILLAMLMLRLFAIDFKQRLTT